MSRAVDTSYAYCSLRSMAVLSDELLSGVAAKARANERRSPHLPLITLRAQPKNRRATQATRIDYEFWLVRQVVYSFRDWPVL